MSAVLRLLGGLLRALFGTPQRRGAGVAALAGISVFIGSATIPGGGAATANLWVDSNGGTCTRQASPAAYSDAAACATLDGAYQAASSGDAVLVKTGTYSGSFTHDADKNGNNADVTIQPDSGQTMTLDGIGSGSQPNTPGCAAGTSCAGAEHITIRNVTMSAGGTIAFAYVDDWTIENVGVLGDAYIIYSSSNLTMRNIEASWSTGDTAQIWVPANETSRQNDNIIMDNWFIHDVTKTGGQHTDCIAFWGVKNSTIKNSRIRNCADAGLTISQSGTSTNFTSDNDVIENNSFGSSADCCGSIAVGNGTTNTTFRFNTLSEISFSNFQDGCPGAECSGLVWDSNVFGFVNALNCSPSSTWRNNIFTDQSQGACSGTNNTNQTLASVKLTNTGLTTWNAALTAGDSTAVAHGNASSFPAADLTGKTRDASPDSGAYEW